MARSKFKPLSFSTTMRNPVRIAGFLSCLIPFEGQILTNEVIARVVRDVIKKKFYKTMYVLSNPELREIFWDEERFFDDSQLDEIIRRSPQHHKEAGFDYGWPSRFDTWYKLQKEYGFVWYSMGEPISISQTGHMLIEAFKQEAPDNSKIQNIFLNAMVKYQAANPFRKVLNSNVPLVLLLNVIKRLKEADTNSSGLARGELSFLICWPDGNADEVYQYIQDFRSHYRFSQYTDEIIYERCLDLLGYGEEGKNYIKMEKVVGESVDEYIRKMKITGIFSLRGNGRFLDFNTLEYKKIYYILTHYQTERAFIPRGTEEIAQKAYYNYMISIDANLFENEDVEISQTDAIRKKRLFEIAREYAPETIREELYNVCARRETKDPMLKFINHPARLEFLTSIALVQSFQGLDVNPNYPVDDEGLPTFTASGGMADIICHEIINDELVEVTLIRSRAQVHAEMLPITRHLREARKTHRYTYSVFIAPTLHEDTVRYIRWVNFDEGLDIKAYDIGTFISELTKYSSFETMLGLTKN